MTTEQECKLGEIDFKITEHQREARRLKREGAEVEEKIAALDAERWQLILTK